MKKNWRHLKTVVQVVGDCDLNLQYNCYACRNPRTKINMIFFVLSFKQIYQLSWDHHRGLRRKHNKNFMVCTKTATRFIFFVLRKPRKEIIKAIKTRADMGGGRAARLALQHDWAWLNPPAQWVKLSPVFMAQPDMSY